MRRQISLQPFPVRRRQAGQTIDLLDQEDIARMSIAEKPEQLGTSEHCTAFVLDVPGGVLRWR
jgi:hypothetical protein